MGQDELTIRKSYHWWIQSDAEALYSVTFPPDHTLEDLEAAFADVERISAEAESDYGFIMDFGQMTHSTAQGRAIVTGSENRINAMPSVKKHCRGVALVVRSAFQRHVLTAVNWFARRPYEFVVVMSRKDAERWLAERLSGVNSRRAV